MSPPLLDYLLAHEPLFRASRLPSLYSDLAVQKTSNPEGYAANVTAWTAALTRAALSGHLPPSRSLLVLHTGDALLDALVSGTYGRPSGLGCVLDECVRGGKFVDAKEFLSSEKSIYSRSWIPSPWAVVRWGLRHAGLDWSASYESSSGRLKPGQLVLVPALEEVYSRLRVAAESTTPALADRVLSRDAFAQHVERILAQGEGGSENESEGPSKRNTGTSSLSGQDLQVLLRYLSRDKQMLSYDATTVKFKPSTSASPEPITQQDHSIASLKSLITTLERTTASLSARISTLQTQASTAVKSGNKTSALAALRSKKLAERTLQQRLDTLAQVMEIFTKIEDAVSQVDVLAVMESSAATLKTLNKKIGGVERVEDVLESLREEVSKVDEVSTALSDPGAVDPKALLDEGEVDDELELMEREEREKVARAEEEKTRARLKEMDALDQLRKQAERDRQREVDEKARLAKEQMDAQRQEHKDKDKELEDALSTSIENMRKLDIDDTQRDRTARDPEPQESADQGSREKETEPEPEPVAEAAS